MVKFQRRIERCDLVLHSRISFDTEYKSVSAYLLSLHL